MVICGLILGSCNNEYREGNPKILIFSKTSGYHHKCIAKGSLAIQSLCASNNIQADTTSNPALFNEKDLNEYAAVIFFNTTGDVLDNRQEVAFERYIQSGGGYVGVHSASDTEYGWSWYGDLAGAYFTSHPKIQEATFIVEDSTFIATDFLPKEWIRTDELYNFKLVNLDVNVVLSVDEKSYEGGTNGTSHPMAWYHEYDGGRAFYTALGHTDACYSEDYFMKHLLGGIQYAIGENKILDYSKATSQVPSSSDRFTKKSLSFGELNEPTEMAILPNSDVLIAQRRGELILYKAESKEIKQVGYLDVYDESGIPYVNAEEGFMGLQADPNFAENNWVYAFYSPTGDLSVNRLSRFKFENDTLQMESEQIILDVNIQRKICCHTGGSIAFGPGGLLYLSTGDNSTPFDEPDVDYVNNGFAPLNDLPGKEQYDARRSSGNTNDLRGKILRIKVNEDGTYDIPEGNLFAPGTEKTRPEIYTMGHRNPYRISVDPKNGYVYWGDVGPDADEDQMDTRGPRGYDEMNQARGPGNFGWPLFIADNKPYWSYNYSNGSSGEAFDPEKPINNSKNNTGLKELPPAQPAYVFYHYGKSAIHEDLSSGARNAMAGPVYYSDLHGGKNNLPVYYDGKIIIYDWMRGWMKAVTLKDDGSFSKLEPFAPDVELNCLIDMEFGPNGELYLLEYGTGWFSKNDDAALSILNFNAGNRSPKINEFASNVTSGQLPLSVDFSVDAMDPESKDLTYKWNFGNEESRTTDKPSTTYVYEEAGSYKASVEVIDANNLGTMSELIPIVNGNSKPKISVEINSGESSTFIPGKPLTYKVSVSDNEDGDEIDESNIFVSVDYLDGFDEASLSLGHQQVSDIAQGGNLLATSICKSCHKINEKSIGPSYFEVAEKYSEKDDIVSFLSDKIINGSSGNWGENVMPANTDIDKREVQKIVKYIMSLSNSPLEKSLPISGSIVPEPNNENKVMVITASYTDMGAEGVESLTGIEKIVLKSEKSSNIKD